MNNISKAFVGLMFLSTPCFGAMQQPKPSSIFDILQMKDVSDSDKFTKIQALGKDLSAQDRKKLCEQRNNEGETPLLAASENFSYPAIISLLLDWGADSNARSAKYRGQTSLHKLAGAFGEQRGSFTNTHDFKHAVLEKMIKAGGDLGALEGQCRRTPVHIAAQQAKLATVMFIVRKLAEQNKLQLLFQEDSYKRNALKFAIEGMNIRHMQTQDVVDFLNKLLGDSNIINDLKKYKDEPEMLKAIIESIVDAEPGVKVNSDQK
jgi:ankyrin repeat protein